MLKDEEEAEWNHYLALKAKYEPCCKDEESE
jgi:hypothetical protein